MTAPGEPAAGPPPGGGPRDPTSDEERVLAAIDDTATVALLVRLVRAVSEDPPGDEAAAAAVVVDALAAAGIPSSLREVMPGRPDLHAAIGAGSRPCLVFNGHLDTMPAGPGWTVDPFAAVIADGRLVGRGAADAKGGLAAMIGAMVALHGAGVPLRGRLALHAVVDEEAGGAGTRMAVQDDPHADWAIVAEPTGLAVARASNGQVDVRVRFAGRAAHGSTPQDGRSAIADAARFVGLVEARQSELAAGDRHPLTGPASILVGTIAGGVQTSIVPPACELTLDRRLIPGEEPSAALADVDRLLAALAAERPGVAAERDAFLVVPPVEVAPDDPVVRALGDAVARITGRPDPIAGLRATSDAATYAAAGIPAVVFGPGSLDVAHRPDESVPLDEVLSATRILALTALRLLA